MIRCLGIDPGSVIGLCLIEIEESLGWAAARFLDYSSINRPEKKKLDPLAEHDRDLEVARRVEITLLSMRPDVIAIEQAAEAKGALYRGYTKQKTETAFRSGVYYGLVLGAVGNYRRARKAERNRNVQAGLGPLAPEPKVAVYPSVDSKARGRGWQGHSNRKATIARVQAVAKMIHAPDELVELKETVGKPKNGKPGKVSVDFRRHNEADALGIISYHIDRMRIEAHRREDVYASASL